MKSLILALSLLCFNAHSQIILRGAILKGATLGVTVASVGISDFTNGMTIEYVADTVSGSDGDPITSWIDSSGNSHTLAEITPGQDPVIKVSVVNGHRAAQFDGTDDALATSAAISPTLLGTATASTIFAVVKQTGGVLSQNCVVNQDTTDDWTLYAAFSGNILWDDPYNGGSGRTSGAQPGNWADGNFHIVECYRNGGTSEILVDGNSLGTGTPSGNLPQTGTAVLCFGAFNTSGGSAFKGQIARVRIFPLAIGSTDRSTARVFLGNYYGITVTP